MSTERQIARRRARGARSGAGSAFTAGLKELESVDIWWRRGKIIIRAERRGIRLTWWAQRRVDLMQAELDRRGWHAAKEIRGAAPEA